MTSSTPRLTPFSSIMDARFSRRGLLKGALAVSAISATVGTLALETAAEA